MRDDDSIKGSCHCGAVQFVYPHRPERLLECNCSICRRLRAQWAYGTTDDVKITGADDATIAYAWGDKDLAFHTCKTCGCTTHWASLLAESPKRVAVNMALAEPDALVGIRIQHFDGADTWTYLD